MNDGISGYSLPGEDGGDVAGLAVEDFAGIGVAAFVANTVEGVFDFAAVLLHHGLEVLHEFVVAISVV